MIGDECRVGDLDGSSREPATNVEVTEGARLRS
jgi:hypothetical protein